MRVKKFEENRTFKTTFPFNKPLSFKTQLNKVDNLNTTFINSSQKVEAKLNNSVNNLEATMHIGEVEEIEYDEVIYYDGGGVEGYGY